MNLAFTACLGYITRPISKKQTRARQDSSLRGSNHLMHNHKYQSSDTSTCVVSQAGSLCNLSAERAGGWGGQTQDDLQGLLAVSLAKCKLQAQ